MQTKTDAIKLKKTLTEKAQALKELKSKKPLVKISFKKMTKFEKAEKNPIVLPYEILYEKNNIRRRKTIHQVFAGHTSFSRIEAASSTEIAYFFIEWTTLQIESILESILMIDPFQLIAVSPTFGSPGTETLIDARVKSSVLECCKIQYKRESDGVHEESWVSDYTYQGVNRYNINSVVPDMPGNPVDQDLTIQMIEYETYVVEIPDINTPPDIIHIPVRASNKLNFAWNPGVPLIQTFFLNFVEDETTVSPGQTIHLSWNVDHVRKIEVKKISVQGPPLNANYDFTDIQNSVYNSVTTGAFNGVQPASARYQITAKNEFGSVSKIGEVKLRQDPDITIHRVEITQAIQRLTLDETVTLFPGITLPAEYWNNSVDLICQKRTMARVYVDSGITNNFNNGAGPNTQPNVTGEIKIYIPGSTEPLYSLSPLNPTGSTIARPPNDIDRDDMEHTLNFEIPWNLPSLLNIQVEVSVWVRSDVDGIDHQNDTNYSWFKNVHNSTVFNLRPQDGQGMVKVLIADNNLNLAAPSDADYWDAVEGAETRYPVGINDFSFFIAPGNTQIGTNENLNSRNGWEELLVDLVDIAGDYQNNGEIWTGLVPNGPNYAYNGLSWDRYFISRTGHPATFAHELAHCYDIGHADCGNPSNLDNRLPAHINETGVDVNNYEIHAEGLGELMSYCNHFLRETRWPSIALWNILIDEI